MAPASTFLAHCLRRTPVVLAAAALVWIGEPWVAIAAFAALRLAYVAYVGLSLRGAERDGLRPGPEAEAVWTRFRRRASWIMDADGLVYGALVIVTRDTLEMPAPRWVPVALGAGLVALGLGVKVWATRSLADGEYFWRSFFVRGEDRPLSARGPYRWLSDPMYTVGYAHAYGFALAFLSAPGLVAAVAAQVAILGLNQVVERHHVERRERAAARPEPEPGEAS